jgi:hypothetical protein
MNHSKKRNNASVWSSPMLEIKRLREQVDCCSDAKAARCRCRVVRGRAPAGQRANAPGQAAGL